ncbi:MAG: hypothetical protein KatS3mg110_0428 [Pirellulaceae bacterium]|nr:MAG: hypothetical protein KatS3mg110_0428 [Pirellulaceae bacterium]
MRRLLEQGQWDAALGGIHAFGLTSIFLNTILDYLPRMDWPNLVKEFFWLKIIDAVAERLAELIQAGGDQREQILSSLARSGNWDTSWRADWARWLRNKTATVLVRRHADTHSAAALLAPLGLRREHIEHNRAQIERVERINEALAQTGGLPEDENLENLELFGYRRFGMLRPDSGTRIPGFPH